MSTFAALALYPIWAVAAAVGATALRLGRAAGRGLVSLCFSIAIWIAALVLLESDATTAFAERLLPAGILLAAGFVHAGLDASDERRPRLLASVYAACGAVSLVGLVAPRLFFGPGARTPGPLFFPIALASSAGSVFVLAWLARRAFGSTGIERKRRLAIAVGCLFGSLGGGGVIGLRVLGMGNVWIAAPLLLPAVLLAAYAVLLRETGRAREVLQQGFAYAILTAALSAVGLTAYFFALPWLAPDGGRNIGWLMFVTFFAALPLDPVRLIVVERAGRLLFTDPIGVRDLAEQVEKHEVRADHAERLAEIGRLASAVAHEIRNPLGVIAAQAKLLERQGASEASVAALRREVERARHFLDDLLRYSKPRPLEITEIDVGQTLETVALRVTQAMGEGAPSIAFIKPARSIRLEVDRRAFEDVATALANNAAIAASGRDGARVGIEAVEADGILEVRVEDDGPGVPPEIEARLFEPFVTGRGRDAKHPGTGLGLAIAASWVERHGGAIRHERPKGGGARFVVRWPQR